MRKCGQMRIANSDTVMRPKRHVSDTKKCFSATAVAALSYAIGTIYIVVMSHRGPSCADTTMSQMSQRPNTRNCFLTTTGVTFRYEKCHTSGLTPATKCETAARAMWHWLSAPSGSLTPPGSGATAPPASSATGPSPCSTAPRTPATPPPGTW